MNLHRGRLLAVACAFLGALAGVHASAARRSGDPPRVERNFARVRPGFEPNRGQAPAQHLFLLRDEVGGFALQANGALEVVGGSGGVLAPRKRRPRGGGRWLPSAPLVPAAGVSITPVGGNPQVQPVPSEPLPGRVNHCAGKGGWITDLPSYGRVRYPLIYPGVDLVYYTRRGALEYDFEVRPGTDPAKIVLEVVGADQIWIGRNGDLLISSFGEVLRQRRPVIYQPVGIARVPVRGGYTLLGGARVGFEVGTYNRARLLVIDPAIETSPGSGGEAVAVDPAGNSYVCGSTYFGDIFEDHTLPPHAFVRKLDPLGQPVYTTYLAGSGWEQAYDVAVDAEGNAYVTGATGSPDFPLLNAFQTVLGTNGDPRWDEDAFVAKLNPAGELVYSTLLGGEQPDRAYGIAIGPDGSACVAGETGSEVFPVQNAVQSSLHIEPGYGFGTDGFAARLAPAGSSLVFSTYLGGTGADWANQVAVGPDGDVYVVGATQALDFPVVGALQPVLWQSDGWPPVQQDAFIVRLGAAGSNLVYSTFLGGGGDDQANGVAVDADGGMFICGDTGSWDFPTINAFQPQLGPSISNDGFVTRLTPEGSAAIYSSYLGGHATDECMAITVDTSGFAFLTGTTGSDDLPLLNPWQTSIGGMYQDYNAFVASVNPIGGLDYCSYQGNANTEGLGIALAPGGGVILATVAAIETAAPKEPPLPGLAVQAPGSSAGQRSQLHRIHRRRGRGRFPAPGRPGFPSPTPGHLMHRNQYTR